MFNFILPTYFKNVHLFRTMFNQVSSFVTKQTSVQAFIQFDSLLISVIVSEPDHFDIKIMYDCLLLKHLKDEPYWQRWI